MGFSQAAECTLLIAAASLAVTSCGGGGGGGGGSGSVSPPPVTKNASPGGIWKGTTAGGQVLVGLVTETGQFHFLQDDGVQYFCNMTISGNNVSAGFTGITQVGTAFPNGATSGTGTLSATIAERSTLNGSVTFATATGTPTGPQKSLAPSAAAPDSGHCGSSAPSASANETGAAQKALATNLFDRPAATSLQAPSVPGGTFALTYDVLYDRDSSLATISGSFREPDGTVVSIDASGSIFSQDATTGCVVNGKASVIDARFNAYDIRYTFSSCTGQLAVLNGATFSGLGTLDNTAVPEQAVIAITVQDGTKTLGLIEVLDRI